MFAAFCHILKANESAYPNNSTDRFKSCQLNQAGHFLKNFQLNQDISISVLSFFVLWFSYTITLTLTFYTSLH